jgi:hypothetical protein
MRSSTTFLSPLEKLCCYQSGNISMRRGKDQPLRAEKLPACALAVKKSPGARRICEMMSFEKLLSDALLF